MTPIAAVRALRPDLSPAESREVVLAVLGAVREPSERMEQAADDPFHAAWKASREYSERRFGTEAHASHCFSGPIWQAMIDALVAEVQEEGR